VKNPEHLQSPGAGLHPIKCCKPRR